MTALTVNGSAHAATTLAAAGQLYSATGGTSGNTSTKVGSGTLFKQIFALGTSTNQTGVSSIPAPTDSNWHGWMWDDTSLEAQRIAAGTWTPTIHLLASTGTTVTPTAQWYKRSSAGAYTQIGSVAGSSIALTTSAQLLVFTAPSLSLMDFATGDKLMMWLWVNQTAGGATNSTISVVEATSASTAGVAAGEAKTVTPGYAPTPIALTSTIAGVGTERATLYANGTAQLTVGGNTTLSTTLSTAATLQTVITGTTTGKDTLCGTSTGYSEIIPNGVATAWQALGSIPGTPSGKGELFDVISLEGMTILSGNWTVTRRIRINTATAGVTADLYVQAYKYNGSTYTLIGTASLLSQSIPITTSANFTLTATGLAAAAFGVGDKLYLTKWANITVSNTANTSATWHEDICATAGIGASNDQTVTPGYQLTPTTVALSCECDGIGTLTETLSLNTALTAECDGIGTLSGTVQLSTALTVECDGIGTLTGTLSTSGGVSLSVTMTGVGTLTETLSLATALTDTLTGVGTLTPTLIANLTLPSTTLSGVGTLTATMSEKTALAVTIPGIGTLNGTFSLATALSTTIAGIGTLNGTLSTTGGVSLAVTMAGVGTLTGTITESTALTTTIAGVGTLSPTLSAHLTLTGVSMAGVGTLTGTMAAQTALIVSLNGTGTLSGVFTIRIALSLTFAGMGTLAGVLTIPSLSFLSTLCVTRDMQAIAKTRDLAAIAMTRDEKAGALTRDEQATATTRDEQATAKTRS